MRRWGEAGTCPECVVVWWCPLELGPGNGEGMEIWCVVISSKCVVVWWCFLELGPGSVGSMERW